MCSWPKPRSVSFSALLQDFLYGGSHRILSACSCCLCCSSPPSKLCIRGQGRVGKMCSSQQPRSLHLLPVPSWCHRMCCSSPGQPPAAPVSHRIWESGGLVGWRAAVQAGGGRTDGEEICRVGDSWETRMSLGEEATSSPHVFLAGTGVIEGEPTSVVCQESQIPAWGTLTLELPGNGQRRADPPPPKRGKGLPGREPEGWSDLVVRFWHGEGSTELETLWWSSVFPALLGSGKGRHLPLSHRSQVGELNLPPGLHSPPAPSLWETWHSGMGKGSTSSQKGPRERKAHGRKVGCMASHREEPGDSP